MEGRHRDGDGLTGRIGRAGAATSRLAFRPVRAVALAGKDALADETQRAIDGVLAGPLPEAIGRSLVEHHVVERLLAKALETKAAQAGTSTVARELADEITTSPAFKRALKNVVASPEIRQALERQTVGFGADLADAARLRAENVDERVERVVRRRLHRPPTDPAPRRYAGLGTRATAFVVDAVVANFVFLLLGALGGLFGSLFGALRPMWIVDALAGSGWVLVVAVYFVGFWSTTGQTPGMRTMGLRVAGASGDAPSTGRSVVRLAGLALAIIPMFAGFIPVLFDDRRRALEDYLAGTTVLNAPR
jgi:uncharacterized RDD family membrane protein YckC